MFSVLVTNSFGASEAVQAAFLIERRLDLAATSEPLLQVRQRSTGLRQWLKCGDGTPQSAERLASELSIAGRLSHPHILSPLDYRPAGSELYLVYSWQAEQPLTAARLASLSSAACCRFAALLTDVVHWLHLQTPAITHNCLELENLWLDDAAVWMRLSGFNRAQTGAKRSELVTERRKCWKLAERLLSRDGLADEGGSAVQLAAKQWIDDAQRGVEGLQRAFKQSFLSRVTADL